MALNKFNRNYSLTIKIPNALPIVITPPFTIEFDITRNTLTSANVCQVRLYNLSALHRSQIRFNTYEYGTPNYSITLLAGYGDNLSVIFTGNITQAWSVREGINFITQIECFDGGFAFVNSTTNSNFAAGTPLNTVIKSIMGDLIGVSVGSIGTSYTGIVTRGNTYSGNSAEILDQLTGGGFFVDQGKANALGNNEYIVSLTAPLIISAESGLLGTPLRERDLLRFDMLFEPALNVGTQIQLISATDTNFNGNYKITAVKHRGMISAAVCGSVITSVEFLKNGALVPAVPGG